MAEPAVKLSAVKPALGDSVRSAIDDGISRDLVFAVVSYAGSGATWVATALADELISRGYSPMSVKVRDLLQEARGWVQTPPGPKDDASILVKHEYLQNVGDALRRELGASIAAGLAIRQISKDRAVAPAGKPLAFIIDSLKHPAEVEALRSVYGSAFVLLSVVCLPAKRKLRLKMKFKGSTPGEIDAFLARDAVGGHDAGQHVRKTLHLADLFVINESDEPHELAASLSRFLDLITSARVIRPTQDERGMNAAWGAGLRSACMSRQVGAALLNSDGEVIATGTNDVPQFGGGLSGQNGKTDHRCFADGEFCRNDRTKDEIYKEIVEQLNEAQLLAANATAEQVQKAIERTRISTLVEFSRSVHAEMDALITLARFGAAAASGGTLYVTTYPCHSCARHIVATGIKEVIYLEPYPKSMAVQLHSDSILETTAPNSPSSDKVHLRLFCGVAPRRFGLFEKRGEIKKNSRLHLPPAGTEPHSGHIFTKSFREFEQEIAKRIDEIAAATAS